MEQKYLYVVLSRTPYKIGKLIRVFTREAYNHASIALSLDGGMYSFARRHCCKALYAGFVKESVARYHLNDEPAQIQVFRLPVTPEQHLSIANILERMYEHRYQYLYNHLSAISAMWKKLTPAKNALICVEFCIHILHRIGYDVDPDRYYSVCELGKLLDGNCIYTGPMPAPTEEDPDYFELRPVKPMSNLRSFLVLLQRRKEFKNEEMASPM